VSSDPDACPTGRPPRGGSRSLGRVHTLVISDLHLGIRGGADVLYRPQALDILLGRLEGVRRLVLLGDVLELRGGPARDALAKAEPVMRALGDALGPGGEVLLSAGNHDHAIVAGWLDWRGRRATPEPLELEQRISPDRASWIAKRLTGWLAPATVRIVYPGVWLRADVYATHGHYLDVHCEVPTLERIAAGVMGRMVGALPDPATPEDYEARLAPIYAWIHASAQRSAPGRRAAGGAGTSARAWSALEGSHPRRSLRRYALNASLRMAVLAANRAGLGPLRGQISAPALRTAGLAALAETVRRLRLSADHVVAGHTHRAGLLAGDVAAQWRTPAGAHLHNCGCWVFDGHFIGHGPPGSSPYWPGGAISLGDDGAPQLERLLDDLPPAALRSAAPAR
jgi:hypothetical protein